MHDCKYKPIDNLYIFICQWTNRLFVLKCGLYLKCSFNQSADGTPVPVILLLFNAGPLDISWAVQSQRVSAILECFFPAQATGEALWRVLHNQGEGANPAARLPNTWPASVGQVNLFCNNILLLGWFT